MRNINKRKLTFIFTTVVLTTLFVASGVLMAQTDAGTVDPATPVSHKVDGSSGSALEVPAGFSIIPPSDQDRSDDQILQLNSLTIQKLSGTVPGTIYASQGAGNTCRRYYSVEGGASDVLPCPLAPSILYQIQLQPDTILLLKDRSRASINDFAVGDRINVFGFQDPGTSYVQALIVRDLDKPAVAQYVQLNDLTVLSDPGATVPTSFRAARRGIEPCISFMTGRGVGIPCPLGVQVSDVEAGSEAMTEANLELYRPYREYYTIQVSAGTHIMNLYRQGLDLASIEPGDRINVYGRYMPGTRNIEAVILRDLSVPRQPGQASLQLIRPNGGESLKTGETVNVSWRVNAESVANATLAISLIDGPTQGTIATLRGSEVAAGSYQWTLNHVAVGGDALTNILSGNYRLQIDLYEGTPCLGFCPLPKFPARFIASDASDGRFSIDANTVHEDAPSISSISPASGPHGTKVTLRGEFAATGNYVYVGGYNAGNNLRSDGRTLTFTIPQYVGVCPHNPYDLPAEPVACIQIALQLPIGEHRIHTVNANGTSNNVGFEIVPGGIAFPPN